MSACSMFKIYCCHKRLDDTVVQDLEKNMLLCSCSAKKMGVFERHSSEAWQQFQNDKMLVEEVQGG